MKKSELKRAAENLNELLWNPDSGTDPPIDITLGAGPLKAAVKEGALWLVVTDNPDPVTIGVLRELKWRAGDFATLKPEQDPLPLFQKYEILAPDFKPFKNKETVTVEKVLVTEQEPTDEEIAAIEKSGLLTEKEQEAEKLVTEAAIEAAKETIAYIVPKRKHASAYGMTLEIMAANPTLSLPRLYDIMEHEGFNIETQGNSIKVAQSISKKITRLNKEYAQDAKI